MKYTLSVPTERILSATHDDEGLDIAAGAPLVDLGASPAGEPAGAEERPEAEHGAFGLLIELLRRRNGLTVADLAERARVDPADLVRIITDVRYPPSPRTVYQLARFFGLPERKLLELSKLATPRSTVLLLLELESQAVWVSIAPKRRTIP